MAQGVPINIFFGMMVLFVAVTILLGLYGYRNTKDNEQFLLGRNKTNSLIIALSYGATFLSASAIIGFAGQAATYGMTFIWLCFLNLALGIFIPFAFFGKRVRRLGRKLGASTFSDLFGKIFKSKGIRGFVAALIIVMMPIYCAAVLKGAVNSLVTLTGTMDLYNIVLIILAIIVGLYVIYGGIIAVMYNDAFQAIVMVVGLIVIFAVTLYVLGGFSSAVNSLSDMNSMISTTPPGSTGFTSVPSFNTPAWWILISTLILGVGIGALTQPQLVVRFMSAKDDKMINRSLIIGSLFIFIIIGVAYTVGAFTNVYFFQQHGMTASQYISSLGLGVDYIMPTYILEVFDGFKFGGWFSSVFLLSLLCAAISTLSALIHTIGVAGGHDIYAVFRGRKKANSDESSPKNMSEIFTSISSKIKAGISVITLSKYKKAKSGGDDSQSLFINRSVTAIAMVLTVVYCYMMPNDIIAKATSLFMGITAAALLPLMAYGLYSKNPLKEVAIASITVGTVTYIFWALFINKSSSIFLPICKWLTGNPVLFMNSNIMYVDALVIALPLSALTLAVAYIFMRLKNNNAVETVAAGEDKEA